MIGSRDGALAFEGRRKYALGTRRGDEMCEFLLMALVSSEGSEVFVEEDIFVWFCISFKESILFGNKDKKKSEVC